jgi:hypothetical protein
MQQRSFFQTLLKTLNEMVYRTHKIEFAIFIEEVERSNEFGDYVSEHFTPIIDNVGSRSYYTRYEAVKDILISLNLTEYEKKKIITYLNETI